MLKFKFADIVISVSSTNPKVVLESPPVYRQFITDGKADIVIIADFSDQLSYAEATPVFLSGGNWDLYKQNGKWVIPVCFPPGSTPKLVANFDLDYQRGELLLNRSKVMSPTYPLAYPLDEFLMINLLSRRQGIELHACAMVIDELGKGLLFTGISGAGKSTLTRLWQQHAGVTILSDDRVILRKKGREFWIYGTPWHGDALGASARTAPVDQIFILKQAKRNHIARLKPVDGAARMLARCFPTFWDPAGMASALELFDELSQSIPCYEFGFKPDQSAIDYIYQNVLI